MTNKKLGLLLLPLLPLSAIGIVEVASAIAPQPVAVVETTPERCEIPAPVSPTPPPPAPVAPTPPQPAPAK